jgi:hypothetical protein
MTWSPDQLTRFATARDCRVAPFREDGKTPGTPTVVWSVVTESGLYIRAYSGRSSSWYQAAVREQAGQLHLDGHTHDVRFEAVADNAPEQAEIDAAYQQKYHTSGYLGAMVSSRARGATVRVLPRQG